MISTECYLKTVLLTVGTGAERLLFVSGHDFSRPLVIHPRLEVGKKHEG
jgi:hypothetical protein